MTASDTSQIMWGVDRSQLNRACAILIDQRDQAPPGEAHDRLGKIIRYLEQLDRFVSGDRTEVPVEILRQMMATGADAWVAGLLGWSRDEVRYQRQLRGIPAASRGGGIRERQSRREAWEREWAKRLRALRILDD